MRETGSYQFFGSTKHFIPHPLPPQEPLRLTIEMLNLLQQASHALGRLNEMSARLPNREPFIKAYILKEAMLTSEIEGIHTTVLDVYTELLEAVTASKNTRLVLNYSASVDAALDLMQKQGYPLTIRVLLTAHSILLSGGKQDHALPGEFRKQAVKVGNLIPPPASEVPRLMSDLERYINTSEDLPALLQAGLAHVQFETIHPFADGNGRVGRLLIILMLIDKGLLHAPLLYPSTYFKKHHYEYYMRLDKVRTEGDFEGWILYYLKAIHESAIDAYNRAKDIEALYLRAHELVATDPLFARSLASALLVLDAFFSSPISTISSISQAVGKAYNTVHSAIQGLVAHHILTEHSTPLQKTYHFTAYLELLQRDY